MTEGLIVLNLLVYLTGLVGQYMGLFTLEEFTRFGHFDPRDFKFHQLITSLFFHDPYGIWHIAFNMLFLWVFGAAVEDRLRRISFLAFYLMGGIVANLAHGMMNPHPVIGASGAIAAVTGAFLALFPRSKIVIVFFFFFIGIFHIPSLWFIGFYFVIDLLRQTGDLLGRGGSDVAYMAHIAGYLFGFMLAFLLLAVGIIKREEFDVFFLFTQMRRRARFRAASKPQTGSMWDSSSTDTGDRLAQKAKKKSTTTEPDKRVTSLRADIASYTTAGDLKQAAETYRELLRVSPTEVLSEPRQLEIANQLCAEQDHTVAAQAYELLLTHYPRCAQTAEVRLILGLLYARQLNRPQKARELITLAKSALHDPGQTALADQLLAEL